jgi:hypothetical protein
MAHEYTHAWQSDRFPNDTSLLWVEGLAEWMAYKTLVYYGYHQQASLIPVQLDVYGQGFRKVQKVEQKYGEKNVLARVLKIVNKKR